MGWSFTTHQAYFLAPSNSNSGGDNVPPGACHHGMPPPPPPPRPRVPHAEGRHASQLEAGNGMNGSVLVSHRFV
jgi:hypothetical protein